MQRLFVICAAAFITAIGVSYWISSSRAQETSSSPAQETTSTPPNLVLEKRVFSAGSPDVIEEQIEEHVVDFNLNWNDDRQNSDPLHEADRSHTRATRDLVAKYRGSSEPQERDKLREELNQTLVKHFEVRQQVRARELEELEAQVRRLRELHARREQEKELIVRERLSQLLRDADGLGWGSSDESHPAGRVIRDRPVKRREVYVQ